MYRAVAAESLQTKSCTSTLMIGLYLKRYPNWFQKTVRCKMWLLALTLVLTFEYKHSTDMIADRERQCTDTIGAVLVPLGWPSPMLTYKCIFSNKIYGNHFIKQHSENCYGLKLRKCADCSLKNIFIVSFIIIFQRTFVPDWRCITHWCRKLRKQLLLSRIDTQSIRRGLLLPTYGGLCVRLSVTTVSPTNTAEPIEVPFGCGVGWAKETMY